MLGFRDGAGAGLWMGFEDIITFLRRGVFPSLYLACVLYFFYFYFYYYYKLYSYQPFFSHPGSMPSSFIDISLSLHHIYSGYITCMDFRISGDG